MNQLDDLLTPQLEALPEGELWLGFSGGLDSCVLLHALAALPLARRHSLTALHICHHLQAQADEWAEHCQTFAEQLDVRFIRHDVHVSGIEALGVEAAARKARYTAFDQCLPSPSTLALAHHQNDQAETVLMRLLHGAGHEGLAGMKMLRALRHNGSDRRIWRPLLNTPRSVLERYAQHHRLDVIDDPSNADVRFMRNRLRHRVLPVLRKEFPNADATLIASAKRLREEADALDFLAQKYLQAWLPEASSPLKISTLTTLPPAFLRRVIGAWLDQRQLPRPPSAIWPRIVPELFEARPDGTPSLSWRGARLRRYRDHVWADNGTQSTSDYEFFWDGSEPLPLPNLDKPLAFDPPLSPGCHQFVVRNRRGGEKMVRNQHHQSLKKCFQSLAIPPWQREQLPLLFSNEGTLLSLAGRYNSDRFTAWLHDQSSQLLPLLD